MMQNFDDQSLNPGTLLHREWAKESIVYSMRYDEESGSVPESQRLACQLRQPVAILLLPKTELPADERTHPESGGDAIVGRLEAPVTGRMSDHGLSSHH
jgi:acetylornithine deacetylase/succinyl-diaminopimelate desuccinylase-like protein